MRQEAGAKIRPDTDDRDASGEGDSNVNTRALFRLNFIMAVQHSDAFGDTHQAEATAPVASGARLAPHKALSIILD